MHLFKPKPKPTPTTSHPLAVLMRRDAQTILWGALTLSACFMAAAMVLGAAFTNGLLRTLAGLLWMLGLVVLVYGSTEALRLQRRAKRILAAEALKSKGR